MPALADVGIQNDFGAPIGFVAPAGTPRQVVDKLAGVLARAVQTPEFLKRAEAFYVDIAYRTPEQHAEIIRADIPRFQRAVKISGATAE